MQFSYFNENTRRRENTIVITIDSPDEIGAIISALLGLRRAGLNLAANEQPMGLWCWLSIYIYIRCDRSWSDGETMSHRLYLYTRNGNEYIRNGYVGIFRINPNNSIIALSVTLRITESTTPPSASLRSVWGVCSNRMQ